MMKRYQTRMKVEIGRNRNGGAFPAKASRLSGVRAQGVATLLGGLFLIGAMGSTANADERKFTYSYEAVSILPKGGMEFEQWVTYRGGKEDGTFAGWDLREELEFGVTDRYTTALYLNTQSETFRDVPGHPDSSDFEFDGISSEHKYQVLNPYTQPLGLLLYGEVSTDGEELELEEKLVLQKYFGEKWNVAFNAIFEQEWEFEGSETHRESALDFTGGVSYEINRNWAVGLEAMNFRGFEGLDFGEQEDNAIFAGPNIHYGTSDWWATLTVAPQITGRPDTEDGLNLDAHERVQVRLILGIVF